MVEDQEPALLSVRGAWKGGVGWPLPFRAGGPGGPGGSFTFPSTTFGASSGASSGGVGRLGTLSQRDSSCTCEEKEKKGGSNNPRVKAS